MGPGFGLIGGNLLGPVKAQTYFNTSLASGAEATMASST